MHTARQLKESQFEVAIDGRPSAREELLSEWGPPHRLGVVIHEPFGAIGASYLLQLAISAFYDARPSRRDRQAPVYPDVFAFHIGDRWGDLVNFDIFPARKQVYLPDEPIAILGAINDRGITHLLVPDRRVDRVQHEFKEPAQALDRMVAAWAYHPSGRTPDADVAITGKEPVVEANTKVTLNAPDAFYERQRAIELIGTVKLPDDELLVLPDEPQDEVAEDIRLERLRGRDALKGDLGWTETYRRISVREALGMLHIGAPPPFKKQADASFIDA